MRKLSLGRATEVPASHSFLQLFPDFDYWSLNRGCLMVASPTNILMGASRRSRHDVRGEGMRDAPLRVSAGEASLRWLNTVCERSAVTCVTALVLN